MTVHHSADRMVAESLPEYITAADFCVNYSKANGGCLGYPAALLLFAVVDALGSFHRANQKFNILIDGKNTIIRKKEDHFIILNSKYYQLSLSKKEVALLQNNYRHPLAHNSLLMPDSMLDIGDGKTSPFEFIKVAGSKVPGRSMPFVHLKPFLALSKIAVERFLHDAEDIISNSKQVAEMTLRADRIAKNAFTIELTNQNKGLSAIHKT